MKQFLFLAAIIALLFSCTNKVYETNGETIYRTGRNQEGEMLLDRSASRYKVPGGCKTCHGRNGDKLKNISIRFDDLSAAGNSYPAYTDSLFFRFLDLDLRSDGSKANIGVIWKMSVDDKRDLLEYLKRL